MPVAVMGRIEGAAEQADAQARRMGRQPQMVSAQGGRSPPDVVTAGSGRCRGRGT